MESSDPKSGSQSVRVAVNVRPLVTPELVAGCSDCIIVTPGEPQVQIGSHSFTFDYVYGSTGSTSSRIFDDCVAPLVDALLHGYNATVLAYGQTGSGKTYTMGTNYNGESSNGIIPKVMQTIFKRVEETKKTTEYLIRVSFIEIFKEEVFDLLDSSPQVYNKADGNGKPAGPSRAPIQIRETANGGISLAGVTEAEVTSQDEMASYLLRGSVCRATGSTNMNSQSSRSHAIFTISMEQKRISGMTSEGVHDDVGDDILCAKLHLVDLAGSERAKKTGADGMRLREGIHINKGLLALGNVISALGDDKKRKEGGHVPYRDSKLTRLLQDSLGGNSKTVMIACVSPADTNAEETLNTLKYANRARNIQNKAIVNRDPVTAQMQRMKSQIEQLQAELIYVKGDSSTPFEELQILKQKITLLETSNTDLQKQLQEYQVNFEHLTKQAIDAQFEKDKLLLKLESARDGKPWDEIDCDSNQDMDLLKTYVSKIQDLEGELMRLRKLNTSKRSELIDYLDLDDNVLHPQSSLFPESDSKVPGDSEDEEKELEHCSLQEKLDNELKELDKRLEQKEAEMKRVAGGDTSVLKQHYEKKVQDLEQEKRNLQKEIEQLRCNLANISSTSDDSTQKLKESYLQKLNFLESQVVELKKKQDAQAQLLRQKQRSDEAAKKLQDEIHRIKTQKVQLQQKIKQESEQFRLWKASREKEVLQLKKEGRRNEYEMHKLLALNQRQKMVLQRKTEEASMATKRLKELLESRKASSRETFGNSSGPGLQALMHAIEHELEVTVRVHEVRCEYERQKEEMKMAKEVAELKDEANIEKQSGLSQCAQTMSPGARNSRIFALENMLATSSSTIVSMASQLSEAEERERAFSGRGRWNHVRSLADAKIIMNNLFNLASSSRCQLWDKEVDCREKDSEIRSLKEKIVSLIRQVEMQKEELSRQEKFKKLILSKSFKKKSNNGDAFVMGDADGHVYDLRPKGLRNSIVYTSFGNMDEAEDMDTDVSDHSDNETDTEWLHSEDFQDEMGRRKRQNTKKRNSKIFVENNTDAETHKIFPREATTNAIQKTVSGICCSCSKSSSCKTQKCECRAVDGFCSISCGCHPKKCSNRDAVVVEESDVRPPATVETMILSDDEGIERSSSALASQGAMLLQSALSDKPAEIKDADGTQRKPLSDIGNKVVKPNAPKPSAPRKKWRKSVAIQLIPVSSDQPTSQPEEAEVPKKQESSTVESNIPRLPRAMRNTNAPLRDRNSEPSTDTTTINKEPEHAAPRSPHHQARPPTAEKENHGC